MAYIILKNLTSNICVSNSGVRRIINNRFCVFLHKLSSEEQCFDLESTSSSYISVITMTSHTSVLFNAAFNMNMTKENARYVFHILFQGYLKWRFEAAPYQRRKLSPEIRWQSPIMTYVTRVDLATWPWFGIRRLWNKQVVDAITSLAGRVERPLVDIVAGVRCQSNWESIPDWIYATGRCHVRLKQIIQQRHAIIIMISSLNALVIVIVIFNV